MKQRTYFLRSAVISFLLLSPLPVSAESFIQDQDVHALCEGIMQDVYQEILAQKANHPELSDFQETDAQSKNNSGITSIGYVTQDVKVGADQVPYAFQLTIAPVNEIFTSPSGYKAINLSFPVLDLKIAGYQNAALTKEFYNIQDAIQKYGIKLWDEQQKYLPYKISIEAVKESFRSGEDIEFIVKLTNDSKANYKLKRLDAKTLYFVFDNKPWGAQELADKDSKSLKEILLKPGQTIQKKFRAPGFKRPQTVEINVTYNFPYKGVKPSAKLTLPIGE
jgi:hypothetical protein